VAEGPKTGRLRIYSSSVTWYADSMIQSVNRVLALTVTFELEMPLADNIWLPKHFAMRSRAKYSSCSPGSHKRTKCIAAITNVRQLKAVAAER